MWIGIALLIGINGTLVWEASRFKTEADCRAEITRIAEVAQQSENVFAYRLDCVSVASFTIKKTSAAPRPKPSTEPPPKGVRS